MTKWNLSGHNKSVNVVGVAMCFYVFILIVLFLTKIARPSKLARDAGLAKKLWEISETMVGLKPEERHF